MPVVNIRTVFGGASLTAALIVASVVPAGATSALPTVGGASGVIENSPTGFDFQNRQATGEVLTYALATRPRHGTAAVIGPTASTILYTPERDFVGDDSFSYTVTDGDVTSAPGVMRLSIVKGGPAGTRLSPPRSTAIPVGGVDGDGSSRLTISGRDFIDSEPDGRAHVLPVGADVIEAYHLPAGGWVFEDISRNAYDPVQMNTELAGPPAENGGIALGTHHLVHFAGAPATAFTLHLTAFHRDCGQQTGTETVRRFDVDATGDPVAVDLTFAVTCAADPLHVMRGSLHWRALTGSPTTLEHASVPSHATAG